MEKPRITYAAFAASQMKYQQGSVAALIERFIKEMESIRPVGDSHELNLRRIQRHWIGAKAAVQLVKRDIIDFGHERRKTVCAATVGQDITFLTGVLKYAGSAWDDCADVSDAAIAAAKPFMKKHGLIGKSTPRTRRPTADEKLALETYFAKQNEHARTKIDMVKVSRWQHRSTRRIGETCALLWRNWLPDDQTILVAKMKDPKNRDKKKVVGLPWDAQEMLFELAWEMNAKPELRNDEPRIFPYNKHCCSQRYSLAKNALSIVGLHLHDDRRDRGSRLVEVDGYSKEEAIAFTGHDTTQVFERTYMVLDAALIATKGPASQRLEKR